MKRFTETNKWRDPWYLALSITTKAAFEYVRDNCDNAGVWEPSFDLANYSLKATLDWDVVFEELGDRVRKLENGKWYLTRFIRFQCKEYRDCPPHNAVVKLLREHGMNPEPWMQGKTEEFESMPKEEAPQLPGLEAVNGQAVVRDCMVALAAAEGSRWERLTKAAKERVEKAYRQIHDVDPKASGDDIRQALKNWPKHFNVPPSAKGLASHWGRLTEDPETKRQAEHDKAKIKARVTELRSRARELCENRNGRWVASDILSPAEANELTKIVTELTRYNESV